MARGGRRRGLSLADAALIAARLDNVTSPLWGFAAGLIVAPIIAFSANWVSTTGARDDAMETARVETLTDSARRPRRNLGLHRTWTLPLLRAMTTVPNVTSLSLPPWARRCNVKAA